MHKLGSSAIGCEDFSTPGGITNWVSVCIGIVSSPIGYIYIYVGYEGFVQPQKGQGEAKLNYNQFFCRLYAHIWSTATN